MAADTTTTALMNLVLPVVGLRAGPTYANDWNLALSTIDAHDHSSGKGTKVTPAGLNINSDLSFGSNSATSMKTVSFSNQSATFSSSTQGAVYVSGGDLYYNNSSGTTVQLTSGSTINVGSVQGISGLASPASATFSTPYFTLKSASTTYGKVAHADLDLYEATAGITNKVTIKSSASLSASYSLTLPSSTPAALAYMTMSSSGVLSTASADAILAAATSTGIDSLITTMSATEANNIAAKLTTTGTGSIASTMSAANANTIVAKVTRATGTSVAAGGVAIGSATSSTLTNAAFTDLTNLTVTITTSGRPVMVAIQSDGLGGSGSGPSDFYSNSSTVKSYIKFLRGSTEIAQYTIAAGKEVNPCFFVIDAPTAGTYTYKIQGKSDGVIALLYEYLRLVAYEL